MFWSLDKSLIVQGLSESCMWEQQKMDAKVLMTTGHTLAAHGCPQRGEGGVVDGGNCFPEFKKL